MTGKRKNRTRIFAFMLSFVLLIVFNSGFTVTIQPVSDLPTDMTEDTEDKHQGQDDLFFKSRNRDVVRELYTMIKDPETKLKVKKLLGKVTFSHNEAEFLIYVQPDEGFTVMETRAYIGTDPVPLSIELKPDTGLFPFRKKFPEPVASHLMSIDIFTDLGLTWRSEDAEKLLQNVAVFCQVKGMDGKNVVVHDAWVGELIEDDRDTEEEEDGEYVGRQDEADGVLTTYVSGSTSFTYRIKELTFNKNVSKSAETSTDKAKIEVLPVYVPAHRANGDPVEMTYRDELGNSITGQSPVHL